MGLKICTVGCGAMAMNGHGPSYKKYAENHPDIELAACCDIVEQSALRFREMFGFARHYTDMIHMLESEKPDAVCLLAPPHLTAELSVQILQRGYPLITEKPPGLTKEETLRIIAAAEEANVPNQVAFNRRYIPLVRELKNMLVHELQTQDLQNIRYDFYRVGRKDPDFSTTAIHGIDTVRYLAGSDYKNIRFHYQQFPNMGAQVANIFMDCVFESGATAQLNFCPVAGAVMERATIHAYDHTFLLNLPIWNGPDYPGRLTHIVKNKINKDVTGTEISDGDEMFEYNGFYAENKSFFDDLRSGKYPANNIRSGLQSVEIAEYIRNREPEYYR